MMIPIQVIRWYRMRCYGGTDSPILSHNDKNYNIKKASWNPYLYMKIPTGFTISIPHKSA